MEHLPDIKQLQNLLTGKVDRLSYLDSGGFKAVYKGYVHERLKAIKVVYIPGDINEEELTITFTQSRGVFYHLPFICWKSHLPIFSWPWVQVMRNGTSPPWFRSTRHK